MVKKVGGEQERGIRSKKFARQAKAWTTEIVLIFVYTHTGYKRITHGFRFTYIKEYPHPPGNLLQHELNSDVTLLITAHKKKNLATFIFVVGQVQKWVRLKRGKYRNSTCLAPMLQNNLQVFNSVARFTRFYCSRLLKYLTMLLVY